MNFIKELWELYCQGIASTGEHESQEGGQARLGKIVAPVSINMGQVHVPVGLSYAATPYVNTRVRWDVRWFGLGCSRCHHTQNLGLEMGLVKVIRGCWYVNARPVVGWAVLSNSTHQFAREMGLGVELIRQLQP